MQYRTTLLLLFAAIGLVTYIVLVERHQSTSDEVYDREKQGRILEVTGSEITHLSITRAGKTVELQRVKEPGDWEVVKPMRAKASYQQVGDIVTRFDYLREKSRLPPPASGVPYDLAEFGLAPPLISVTFRWGEKTATLHLGKPIAVGTDRYARLEGVDHIFLIDPGMFAVLDKNPSELMDRRAIDLDFSKLTNITLESSGAGGVPKAKIEMAGENGIWTIEGERKLATDQEEMMSLGKSMQGLEAVDVLDPAAFDAAKAGLLEPRLILTAAEENGKKIVKLAIGAPLPDKPDLVYARIGDGPGAITLKTESVALFAPDLNRLRSKIYFDIPDAKPQQVAVETPAGRTVVKADGSAWVCDAPAGMPVDFGSVNNFLMRIRVFKVVQFVGPAEGDLARYGLAPPRFSLTVTMLSRSGEPFDLAYKIGWTDAQPENVLAVSSDGKEIVRLDASAKELYSRGSLSFRRTDLLSIPSQRLAEFTIERRLPSANAGASRPIRKQICSHPADDPEGWQVREDDQIKKVPAAAVAAVADHLTEVWAVEFAADHPPSLAPFGLDQPEITATIQYRDGDSASAPLRTEKILIGPKTADGSRYCTLASNPIVFTWDEEIVRLFERDLTLPPPEEAVPKNPHAPSGS